MNSTGHGSLAVPAIVSTSIPIAARMPALALLAFGLVTLYWVGFSSVSAAHNATHDTRHANGFPCH